MARGTRRLITHTRAFWDASALVPLCTTQINTEGALAFYNHYDIAVWWGTPIEIASALGRLRRMKELDDEGRIAARQLSEDLSASWLVIWPSDALLARALQLVDQHELRAGDALQLAAALEWSGDRQTNRVFLTSDERLRRAALLNGFDVIYL